MSGVGESERAIRIKVGADAGGEASEIYGAQYEVQVAKEHGGGVGVAQLGCSDEQGCGHGCGRAFSAHVAEQDSLGAVGENAAEVEVAAYFSCGEKGDLNGAAGSTVEFAGANNC